MSSKLLIDESPLLVLPSLAAKIGLHEALLLQQIHYWLMRKEIVADNTAWIYNSYSEWRKQFPFWSVRTIQRIALSLESQGLLKARTGVRSSWDRSKHYTIDYDRLTKVADACDKLSIEEDVSPLDTNEDKTTCPQPSAEVVNASCQVGTIDSANLARSLYEDYTETTNTKSLVLTSQKPKPKRARKDGVDPRWGPIRDDLKLYWQVKNPGLEMPFNGRIDGKALAEFLRDFPALTREQWQQCLQHRARSEVVHSEPIRYWIRRLMSYYEKPLDRFGKQYDAGSKHEQQKNLSQGNKQVISRWLTGRPKEESDAGDIPVPVRDLLGPSG